MGLSISMVSKKSLVNITMMVGGDSIANALGDTDGIKDDFIGYLSDRGIEATITDGAQGGMGLANFVDLDTGGKGPKYISLWDTFPNKADITDIHFTIGANDVVEFAQAQAGYTKAPYKASFIDLINLVFSDFPSLERFYIRPIGRYVNDGSVNYPTALQDIRELQTEIAEELDNVYLLPPYYDEPQSDHVHPTPETYQLMALRDSYRIANVLGLQNKLARGMTIASAEVSNLGIEVTVNFDSGNDITVPTAGEGLDFFRLDGATNFASIDRVDANIFRLYGGAPYTGTPTLETAYGQMFDLGLVPETVQENGALTLPLVQEEITVTNTIDDSDPILRLTNLSYYSRPELYARNTTAGNNFDSMASINNGEFELYDAGANGYEMVYDATAFDNVGGFRPSVDGAFIRGAGDKLDPSGGFFLGFTIQMEETISAEQRQIMQMGREAGVYGNARLYQDNVDRIILQRDDITNTKVIANSVSGNSYCIFINVISATEGEVYVNNSTAITFDPRADWLIKVGDGGTYYLGDNEFNTYGGSFVKTGSHDAVNDPSISDIMDYMKAQYNIT